MHKNVIITGATKGIGKAIALQFAKKKCNIAVCARSIEDLNEFEEELTPFITHLTSYIFYAADVSNKKQLAGFAEKILSTWDRVDILVNNAGVFVPGQIISEPEGSLEKMIETNLYSAYNLTRAIVPLMIKQRKGHIFNISSVAGLKAYHNGGSYSISKFAMIGLSKALREELKPHNIGVTTLMPGATLTSSWEGVDLPESRFMKPEDIGKIVFDIYALSENTVVEEVLLRPMLGDI